MEKERILCIDDDINTLNTVEEVLMRAGYEVSLAKSGEQGLKLLSRGIEFRLILLDVDMPKMDGYQTFLKIREIESCKEVPIIFLTGMDSPDFEIKGLEIGAVDYITKPFVSNVFLARIKNRLLTISNSAAARHSDYNEEALKKMGEVLNSVEISIAKCVADGLSNMEIAEKTNYSYAYVKKMVSGIMEKLYINKRTEIRKMLKND